MSGMIVAEITKNWTYGTPIEDLLSQRFERVIETNAKRGYILHDWKLTSCAIGGVITETIVAVFKIKS